MQGPTAVAADAGRHLGEEELIARWSALAPPPRETGTLAAIVCRTAEGMREMRARARLLPGVGLDGDRQHARVPEDPDRAVTIMRRDAAELFANGQPVSIYGDNLLVELDLSPEHLPVGTRLAIGEAVVEVSAVPHLPCRKFRERVGREAARLAGSAQGRAENLRGILCRVVESGAIVPGDAIRVLRA